MDLMPGQRTVNVTCTSTSTGLTLSRTLTTIIGGKNTVT